jgi:hypothetical protein
MNFELQTCIENTPGAFKSAVDMSFLVPALARICVLKIVKDIKEFCPGVNFGDLGKYQSIVGPFQYLCELQHRSIDDRSK